MGRFGRLVEQFRYRGPYVVRLSAGFYLEDPFTMQMTSVQDRAHRFALRASAVRAMEAARQTWRFEHSVVLPESLL